MGLERRQFVELLPQLIKKPSLLFNDARVLADAIPMFTFMAPFGQLVFGPTLLNFEYHRQKRPERERKMLVSQEFFSQIVSVSVHVVTFLSGGLLARKVLPKLNAKLFTPDSLAMKDAETLASLVGGFVGGTFIRPVISAKAMDVWSKHQDQQSSRPKPAPPQQLPLAPVRPMVLTQSFVPPRAFQNPVVSL